MPQPVTSVPQWSPPLNGGSTVTPAMLNQGITVPQWSPPLNGGSTGRRGRKTIIRVPQWSPPLNGGSTDTRDV